eukprot:CAMPEP_0185580452 /NCGR_PEP_ID=MMETSP0434-20130131/16563_1 /TAXON_ID=626734 ORGANISM="Favella taraikaensis, Strain Fe Narragansett Bay" /NCGR_SAMPLE_ID=MMETSP0434 /ASSEMBLY_ACC=CAM_ASM_000379 /LENGTH=334 /DNA_ID=CAMNT_0028198725 /DNA_START=137 /DNA_END=1140 /DNA_ORIENTATION=-
MVKLAILNQRIPPPQSSQAALDQLHSHQDRESLLSFLRSIVPNLDFYYATRDQDGDLRDLDSVDALFDRVKPTYVIHLAAKVGGLFANMSDKVGFFESNLAMNSNVIKSSHKHGVKRLVCVLSTCIYPDVIEYPIEAGKLHAGPPHPSNEGYAYAKRMCALQCRLYNEQYGTNFVCVVPTNLYGPNDCYVPDSSHVVAALIRRASELPEGAPLTVWGSGTPLRQFCYTPDLACLLLWVAFDTSVAAEDPLPLLPENEHSIGDLARFIAQEFHGHQVVFDTSKADGQFRKCMSNAGLRAWLPNFNFTSLEEGIRLTVADYKANKDTYRHATAAKL